MHDALKGDDIGMRIAKTLTAVLLALCLIFTFCLNSVYAADLKPDDSISFEKVNGYKYTNCNANLRTGNSTEYPIIVRIKKDTKVGLIGRCSNGWYKVDCGGTPGFMANSVLSDEKGAPANSGCTIVNNFDADKELISELKSIIDGFDGEIGFYAETADGEHILSCNSDMSTFVASAMKVPLCMYICQKYEEKGEDVLSQVHNIKRERKSKREDSGLAYHPKYYPEALYEYYGEGVLSNDLYKTRDLMDLALTESDNLAKEILQRKYTTKSDINKWLKNIGCERSAIYSHSDWLFSTAEDLVTIWKEYYSYSQSSESGELLFSMSESTNDTRLRILGKPCASKYGYTNQDTKVYVEAGMVLGESPYYIALTYKFRDSDMDFKLVDKMINLIDSAFEDFAIDIDEDLVVTIDE